MTKLPTGKGMFWWIPQRDGTPEDCARLARNAGLTNVNIKLHDGADSQDERWSTQFNKPKRIEYIKAMRNFGVEVHGWCAIYPNDANYTRREIDIAKKVIDECEPESLSLDIEGRWQEGGWGPLARKYCAAITSGYPDLPLGMCSYRFPKYFPNVPWEDLLEFSRFHIPQVYWQDSHNPGAQLRESYTALMKLRELPFIPAGSAYPAGKWAPTVSDLHEFYTTAKELKCLGITWWEWKYAIATSAWWNEITAQSWDTTTPPPPMPVLTDSEVLMRLRIAHHNLFPEDN